MVQDLAMAVDSFLLLQLSDNRQFNTLVMYCFHSNLLLVGRFERHAYGAGESHGTISADRIGGVGANWLRASVQGIGESAADRLEPSVTAVTWSDVTE